MHEENELRTPITPKSLKLAETKIIVKHDACVCFI